MTMRRIMRGTDPSVYRQDWITTSAITALPAGTASVDFTVSDASLFPRGTGSGEPGECVIMSDTDSQAGREVLYDWTSVSGNTLIGCSRRYGSSTSAGAVVKISFTGGMYEAFRAEVDAKMPASYLDTDGTLSGNSDSKVASQKATKTFVETLWYTNYNLLTSSAQIRDFLASDTERFAHVAEGAYEINASTGDWVMNKSNKELHFIGNCSLTIATGYKWSTGHTAGVEFYDVADLQAVVDPTTHLITGRRKYGGAIDWKSVAETAGARLYFRGLVYSIASATANTITVPAAERTVFDGMSTPQGLAVLMIPIRNLKISGNLTVTGDATHTGVYLDWCCVDGFDMSQFNVTLIPGTPTVTRLVNNYRFASGKLPNYILDKAEFNHTRQYFFPLGIGLCHGVVMERSFFSHIKTNFNYNGTTMFATIYAPGCQGFEMRHGVRIMNLASYNSYAGKTSNTYGIEVSDSQRFALMQAYNTYYASGAGGGGSQGYKFGTTEYSVTITPNSL